MHIQLQRGAVGLWALMLPAAAFAGLDIVVVEAAPPACLACPSTIDVPGGPTVLGDAGGPAAERPPVPQVIAPFTIAQAEITVGEIRRFEASSGQRIARGCWIWTPEGRMRFRDAAYWGDPGYAVSDDMPASCLNWEDAVAYTEWLTAEDPGATWRLPTEAEFEYLSRAGRPEPYPWDGGLAAICEQVNGADASSRFRWRNTACEDGAPVPISVTAFPVNAYGVSHVIGNVWEWVADCYNETHSGAPTDGSVRETGLCASRVLRGGSWDDPVENLRASYRVAIPKDRRQANIGFRPVREVD